MYYDNEARLTTQRTKLERLQELLSKAEAMEDIITIESAISETELQIEYLTVLIFRRCRRRILPGRLGIPRRRLPDLSGKLHRFPPQPELA